MKFTAINTNGFAKFEVYDCNFRKPTTIAKHLMDYMESKTGISGENFFDNTSRFWESIETKYGDYHMENRFFEDYSTEDCKEVPEYLAVVVDITRDADGDLVYMYFGFDTTKTGWQFTKDFVQELPKELADELADE